MKEIRLKLFGPMVWKDNTIYVNDSYKNDFT